MIEILRVDTPSLGDRSYLATDGTVALVVDPQRDIDRVLALADERGLRITHVFETHLHNDYLTGGLALARETGAAYHVSAADQVAFDRVPVSDGDVLEVTPTARVQVLATPGHTFTHLAYVLAGADGDPVAVFTGGSLLFGSTGRTDLLGAGHAADLARAQHASAARLAATLPDRVAVLPTHGFGSFCAATPASGADSSTIGAEKARNPALTLSEDRYVADLLAGLDAFPAYYARMGPGNAAGPAAPDLSLPRQAGPAELRRRIAAGEWLVNLRSRRVFAAGHLAGSLGFELGDPLAPQLGWLLPAGTPVTLLGETAGQVAEAQRELARIGIDRPAALATGKPEDWAAGEPLASFPVADFAGLAAAWRERPITVLDVRRDLEWAAGHLDGAVHIPLHELPGRLAEVPGDELWVHCAAGYRAAVAASLLQAAHRQVTAVDDEFAHAAEAGLPVVTEPPAAGLPARRRSSGRSVPGRLAAHLDRALVGEAAHVHHGRVRGHEGRRVGVGVRAEPACLDPDPRGHQDRDPRLVGHRDQGGDRRGQLGRPQVQPPAALVHHGGVAVGDPPPARPADRALERHSQPPRALTRAGPRHGRRADGRALRGQVGQQGVQVGPGPGGQGAAHPRVELGVIQAPLGERVLQPVSRRVPLPVRGPDGRHRAAPARRRAASGWPGAAPARLTGARRPVPRPQDPSLGPCRPPVIS